MGGAPVARALLRTAAAPRALSRRLPCQNQTLLQRRFAGDHGHGHGHGHHAPAGDMNESFGPGFYVCAAAIPTFYFLYTMSRNEDGKTSAFSQMIHRFGTWAASDWVRENDEHLAAIEEKAYNRILFETAPRAENYEPRCPDLVRSHSHKNISASQYVNLDAMTDRYRKRQAKEEQIKAQKLAEKARE